MVHADTGFDICCLHVVGVREVCAFVVASFQIWNVLPASLHLMDDCMCSRTYGSLGGTFV